MPMEDSSQVSHPIFSRAVFVTGTMPIPAIDGAMLYSCHLLGLLAKMSKGVDLFCCPNEMKGNAAADDAGLPENVSVHLGTKREPTVRDKVFTQLPHAALPFASAQNIAILRRLLAEQVDIVVIDRIVTAWTLPEVKSWLSREPNGVLWYATHNAERSTRLSMLTTDHRPWSRPARTAAILLDAWRTDRNERRFINLADVTSAITKSDSQNYRKDYQPRELVTIPPAYFGRQLPATPLTKERSPRICLLGTFIWSIKKANLEAFLRAAHEVFMRRGIELVVIGWIEPKFREELESKWPEVRFTGAVDSVQEHLRDCRLGVVAEQAGGGFKLKILDYVFAGLPVFALRHAVADTPLQHGDSAALFDDVNALCEGIAAHIDDIDYLDRLQRAARQACQRYLPENFDASPLHRTLSDAHLRKTETC